MLPKEWFEKTKRVNADLNLSVGDTVQDGDGKVGKVIEIIKGTSYSDHGFITVNIGDYEEHYAEFNWKDFLRII